MFVICAKNSMERSDCQRSSLFIQLEPGKSMSEQCFRSSLKPSNSSAGHCVRLSSKCPAVDFAVFSKCLQKPANYGNRVRRSMRLKASLVNSIRNSLKRKRSYQCMLNAYRRFKRVWGCVSKSGDVGSVGKKTWISANAVEPYSSRCFH